MSGEHSRPRADPVALRRIADGASRLSLDAYNALNEAADEIDALIVERDDRIDADDRIRRALEVLDTATATGPVWDAARILRGTG